MPAAGLFSRKIPISQFNLGITHIFLISLFILTTYYPSLYTPFVFDDLPNIVTNIFVHPGTFVEIFEAVASRVSGSRPLAMLTFATNYWIGGFDVVGYHIFNLVIHIGNALVLYFCIIYIFSVPGSRLYRSLSDYEISNLAFWSALLWALNPVQHQAVTYIVQRMTSLATLFYLLSLLVFLKFRAKQQSATWAWVLITLFFMAGMACKEIVITLPVSLLLIDYVLVKPGKILNYRRVVTVVGIVGVICLIYLHGNLPNLFEKYPNREFSPYERMLTESRILWHYLSILILPFPQRLHIDYYFDVSNSLVQPLTTLISIMSILATCVMSWFLRYRLPLLSFAFVFFFLTSSVEASFLNLELAFLHRLYLPSLFLFSGLLLCVPFIVKKYSVVFLIILALFSYGTMQRNYDWRTMASLWETDFTSSASPERSIINRGLGLLDLGRYDDTINILNSINNNLTGDDRLSGLFFSGLAHYYKREYKKALDYFKMIRNEFPEFDQLLFYEGMVFLNLNMSQELEDRIDNLKKNFPYKPYSEMLVAERLRNQDQHISAIEVLVKALHNTNQAFVDEKNMLRAYLANIYLETKQYPKAYDTYMEIIRINPNAYFAWQQIYAMQVSAGDLEHANVIRAMLESKGVVLSESTR